MKYFKLIFITFIVLLGACQTDGEFMDTGFQTVQISFTPIELGNKYRVTYNGSEKPYINRSESSVKLEFFTKDKDISILTVDNCPIDKTINLIQPIGQELAVYDENNFIKFTPTIIFINDGSQYDVLFNDFVVKTDQTGYLSKTELPGKMTIINKSDKTKLYSSPELTEETLKTFSVMQLSDTEFLPFEDVDESNPEEGCFKARFLYTQDAFPDYPELKFVLYNCSLDFGQISDAIATCNIKANELSEYVTINPKAFNETSTYGLFDLIDPNDESLYIVDKTVDMDPIIEFPTFNYDQYTGKIPYKFVTFRIVDPNHVQHNGVRMEFIKPLAVAW